MSCSHLLRWLNCLPVLLVLLAPSRLCGDEATPAKSRKPPTPKLTDAEIKTEERVYKQTPQGDLKLYFYFPADWKSSDKRPAILFFFGGGWTHGSHLQFDQESRYFASRGLLAVTADYRIESIHHTKPDKCVEDAKSAMRWLRLKAGEFGIDPDKIIASGGSAGGHLAAATATVEKYDAPDDPKVSAVPNALVLFNPALNMLELPAPHQLDEEMGRAISPVHHLKKGTPPAIIFFGTADKLMAHGTEFVAKSKELGNRAELYTAADMPHGFFNAAPWTQVTTKKADEFLTSLGYLKGAPTIKLPEDAKELKRQE